MGATCQVFVDLAFQGRLRRSAELIQAEIFLFTQLLEQHGATVLAVPGYCLTVPVAMRIKPHRTEILLKVMGVWTTLWLEERQPDVFILYDR